MTWFRHQPYEIVSAESSVEVLIASDRRLSERLAGSFSSARRRLERENLTSALGCEFDLATHLFLAQDTRTSPTRSPLSVSVPIRIRCRRFDLVVQAANTRRTCRLIPCVRMTLTWRGFSLNTGVETSPDPRPDRRPFEPSARLSSQTPDPSVTRYSFSSLNLG